MQPTITTQDDMTMDIRRTMIYHGREFDIHISGHADRWIARIVEFGRSISQPGSRETAEWESDETVYATADVATIAAVTQIVETVEDDLREPVR